MNFLKSIKKDITGINKKEPSSSKTINKGIESIFLSNKPQEKPSSSETLNEGTGFGSYTNELQEPEESSSSQNFFSGLISKKNKSKNKNKIKNNSDSFKTLKTIINESKETKNCTKDLTIQILNELKIKNYENLHERICNCLIQKGIIGLTEFQEEVSSAEMTSLKEKLQPLFENKVIAADAYLLENYRSIPESAERFLIKLLYQANLKLKKSLEPNERAVDVDEMKSLVEDLRERLQIEEIGLYLVDQLLAHLNNQDWTSLKQELTRMLKQIRPLDINEIQRLVNEAENCTKTIKDKNVVLFIGETGVGKSSHIHFLAGSEMVQTKTEKGLNHIMPVNIKNPALKNVTTSASAKSETRFITAVPINITVNGRNEEVFLCDSPGFGDTNGAEMDIANGYSIVKAIQGCKSVRVVLLISYKSMGDKLTGIKNMAHVLIQMISELNSHMKAFSYFFSKFPEHERNAINSVLLDLKEKLNYEEQSDPSFGLFFADMISKTSFNKQIAIDLIKDKPEKYINDLMKVPSIYEPDEVFKVSITERSKAILKGWFLNYLNGLTSSNRI